MITANGFFEGPNQDISWHNVDQEFNEFAIKQLRSVDMILFGRVTYQLMVNYWPTQAALENDPIIAKKMNCAVQNCLLENTGQGRMEQYQADQREYCQRNLLSERTAWQKPDHFWQLGPDGDHDANGFSR